jgi:hypothetical protein
MQTCALASGSIMHITPLRRKIITAALKTPVENLNKKIIRKNTHKRR